MSTEKQLEDIHVYLQNLHDRLKVVENWILEQETKKGNLTVQEQQAITEAIKKEADIL